MPKSYPKKEIQQWTGWSKARDSIWWLRFQWSGATERWAIEGRRSSLRSAKRRRRPAHRTLHRRSAWKTPSRQSLKKKKKRFFFSLLNLWTSLKRKCTRPIQLEEYLINSWSSGCGCCQGDASQRRWTRDSVHVSQKGHSGVAENYGHNLN